MQEAGKARPVGNPRTVDQTAARSLPATENDADFASTAVIIKLHSKYIHVLSGVTCGAGVARY